MLKPTLAETFKKSFKGTWIANFGFNLETATDLIN